MEIRVKKSTKEARINELAQNVIEKAKEVAGRGHDEFWFTCKEFGLYDWQHKLVDVVEKATNGTVYSCEYNCTTEYKQKFDIKHEGEK